MADEPKADELVPVARVLKDRRSIFMEMSLRREEAAARASLGAWEEIAKIFERRGEKYPARKTVRLRKLFLTYHEMQKEVHAAFQEILGELKKEKRNDEEGT